MGLTEVLAAGKARLRGASSSNEVPESPLPTSPRSLNRQAKLHRLLKQLHSQQADGTTEGLPEGALAANGLPAAVALRRKRERAAPADAALAGNSAGNSEEAPRPRRYAAARDCGGPGGPALFRGSGTAALQFSILKTFRAGHPSQCQLRCRRTQFVGVEAQARCKGRACTPGRPSGIATTTLRRAGRPGRHPCDAAAGTAVPRTRRDGR